MTTNYNKDDLESVLRYLTGEYGVEILAGQGSIPGKHDIMRLLPDFFSTKHKGDYSMMRMMANEGIMTKLLSLRQAGTSVDECRRRIAIETQKLTDNFIPPEIASKYVNMIAGIMGLEVPALVVHAAPKPTPTPKPQPKPQPTAKPTPQPVPKPKRPAMSDWEFVELCKSGRAREVEEALQNGANVNAEDKFGNGGWRALHWAACDGHADVVEVLLKHGANVNAKDNGGVTALDWAANLGHADVVEVLLKHGADVNARDNHGRTALHGAGNADVAEVLLKHGADINAKDNDGKTALYFAQRKGCSNVARLLRAKDPCSAKDTGSLWSRLFS